MANNIAGEQIDPALAPSWTAGARRKGVSKRLVVAALVAVAAIAYLIVSNVRGAATYSLTVSELEAKGPSLAGKGVRVSGLLDSSSVFWDAEKTLLKFTIRDEGASLAVAYHGTRPDMFNEGAQVIVEGKLLPDGTFEAKNLMLKCPSKYESGTPVSQKSSAQGS